MATNIVITINHAKDRRNALVPDLEPQVVQPRVRADEGLQAYYEPLQPGVKELRLLEIWAGKTKDEGVECRLRREPLCEGRKYIALSYAWGGTKSKRAIRLNGRDFMINENLHDALRTLRSALRQEARTEELQPFCKSEPGPRWLGPLWIDALCIDQMNIPERSNQVNLLREIYSNANVVISWLGVETPQLSMALRVLHRIEVGMLSDTKNQLLDGKKSWITGEEWLWGCGPCQADAHASNNEAWSCFELLCDLSYWNRCWIIQEVVASWSSCLLLGDEFVRWDTLDTSLRFIERIRSLRDGGREFFPAPDTPLTRLKRQLDRIDTTSVLSLSISRITLKKERKMSFVQLLDRFDSTKATDPRDKVFALLGLAHGRVPEIDYVKSVLDVYIDVAELWTDSNGNRSTDFLMYAGRRKAADASWPSWLPDWRVTFKFRNVPEHARIGILNFHAGRGLDFPFEFDRTYNRMHTTIIPCDSIIASEPRFSGRSYGDSICYILDMIQQSARPQGFTKSEIQPLLQALGWGRFRTDNRPLIPGTSWIWEPMQILRWYAWETLKSRHTKPIGWLESVMSALPEPGIVKERFYGEPFFGSSLDIRIYHTTSGRFVGGPMKARPGDIVAVIPGCSVPVILRHVDGHYEHIGPCFIDGFMHGEARTMVCDGETKPEPVEIW